MGFFDKAKQFLNIGGVKVKLLISSDVIKESGKITGKLSLTTKSPQKVKSIKVLFERKMIVMKPGVPVNTMPDMDNSDTRWSTLGTFEDKKEFSINPGEEKVIDFVLSFQPFQSANSGAVSANVGGVTLSFGANQNSAFNNISYQIRTAVDVDKAAMDATDTVEVVVL